MLLACCVVPYLLDAGQIAEPLQQLRVLDAGALVPVHAVQRGRDAGGRDRAGRELHVERELCAEQVETYTKIPFTLATRVWNDCNYIYFGAHAHEGQ